MSKKEKQLLPFSLEGRFLGFEVEDGYKIKHLRLATAAGECCIKLSKESRASVGGVLMPGDWIQVWGEKTIKGETDETKLKAYRIRVISPRQVATEPIPPTPEKAKAKATILVCQKSDCMKRGGKAVCKALEEALGDRNLSGQVTIRGTGCMKDCKAGPNIVLMPGKTRYSHLIAQDVPSLIDRHFPLCAGSMT